MRYGHYFLSLTGVNIDRITQPDVSKGVNKLIFSRQLGQQGTFGIFKTNRGMQPCGAFPYT